jgi:hypothetical protein
VTIHEAADQAVAVWRDKSREDWRRTLALAEDTRPLWKALQALGLALDEYAKHRPGRRIEYDNLADQPLAEIVVRSDGGPWAVHNQPCAVCGERVAILDLNQGIMLPCARCVALGWETRRAGMGWLRFWWEQLAGVVRGQPERAERAQRRRNGR